MKLLVTGANGFLGSHICESVGAEKLIAGIRSGANLTTLNNIPGLRTVQLSYNDPIRLAEQLRIVQDEFGPLDLVIHNAGLTQTNTASEFVSSNQLLTENLLNAVVRTNLLDVNGLFVFISSLAALGPVNAGGPVSAYGRSKLAAEKSVIKSGIDYLIFRPAAIYGPRDRAFLSLFKSVRNRLYPALTDSDHKMKMIHVRDTASNILNWSKSTKNQIIHLDDGEIYTHETLQQAMDKAFGRRSMTFSLPSVLVRKSIGLLDRIGDHTGFRFPLNEEKYGEISQNWNHDFSEERQQFPLKIRYSLTEGFRDTLRYYRETKMI